MKLIRFGKISRKSPVLNYPMEKELTLSAFGEDYNE